jgi:uncharacterized damage-inducible protein DinB
MFRQVDDFLTDWAYESEATPNVFRALTDAALGQRVTPEGRSAGKLAWHITQSAAGMPGEAGLAVENPAPEGAAVPGTVAEIVTAYERASGVLADAIRTQWEDAMLGDTVPMYGEQWPRGKVLSATIRHQTHHRGQLTVLMRQAGLVVPGCYGPSREEWGQYGMAAQD